MRRLDDCCHHLHDSDVRLETDLGHLHSLHSVTRYSPRNKPTRKTLIFQPHNAPICGNTAFLLNTSSCAALLKCFDQYSLPGTPPRDSWWLGNSKVCIVNVWTMRSAMLFHSTAWAKIEQKHIRNTSRLTGTYTRAQQRYEDSHYGPYWLLSMERWVSDFQYLVQGRLIPLCQS